MAHMLLTGDAPLTAHVVQMVHELASECVSALREVGNPPRRGCVDGSNDELVNVRVALLRR
jgi:hypothetical protein